MSIEEYKLFMSIRRKVATYIGKALEEDGYCKSYEGTWELLVSYPDYFEDETATSNPDFYQITLHCYVIGPHTQYDWGGKTWAEALKNATMILSSGANFGLALKAQKGGEGNV